VVDTSSDLGMIDANRTQLPGATKPFSGFEWMLARRYMGSRRKETFISVISIISFIGIMLGVATLIIVMAVMNGFRAELLDRIMGINGHLIVSPSHSELTDYDALAKRIEAVNGVTMAIPLVEGEVLASGGTGGSGARVRGMREADLKRMASVGSNIKLGTLDGFDAAPSDEVSQDDGEVIQDENGNFVLAEGAGTREDGPEVGVAIGIRMAENLGLSLGDRIKLIAPEGNVSAFGTSPRVKEYPVKAIYEMGMSEYDSIFVFMPLSEAQLYFNRENQVSVIETFVENPDQVHRLEDAVFEAAQRPVSITNWKQRNGGFLKALDIERKVMFLILTLIILVAALNIISGLFMLVKDKGRDIAILRTMGATRGAVMRIFLITGSSIGFLGTFVGFVLGVIFAWNIGAIQTFIEWASGGQVWDPTVRFLSEIPAKLDMWETLMVVLLALGLSLLATIFPAWRAARLDPVEALRYE